MQRDVLRLGFFHCLLLVVFLRLGVAVWAGGRNAAAHQEVAIVIDWSQSGSWFGVNHEAARTECSTGDGGAASGGSTRPPSALGPDEAPGCRVRRTTFKSMQMAQCSTKYLPGASSGKSASGQHESSHTPRQVLERVFGRRWHNSRILCGSADGEPSCPRGIDVPQHLRV